MRFSKLYIPAFALLAFGYPLTTVVLTLASLPVGIFNLLLKALYALLFFLSLLGSALRRRTTIPHSVVPLALFFGLLGLRLVYDIFVRGVYAPLSSPNYILAYFFFLTLLPALSIAVSFERSDLETLNRWIMGVLLLSCAMVFLQLLQSGSQFLVAMATERLEIRNAGEETARLSPITIGMCGAALSVMSMARLSINTGRGGKVRLLLSVTGVVLGLGVLMLAGSRGPLLAFVVATVFLVSGILKVKSGRNSRRRNISKRSFLLIGGVVVGIVFSFQNGNTMFLAVGRLVQTLTSAQSAGVEEVRIEIARDAFNGFLNSPFLGSGHLALQGTAYAHNSVLEALMATGLIGGMLFIGSVILLFMQAWRGLAMRLDPLAFPLAPVVVAVVILSMFSMSTSQSPEIWLTVTLFLTIAARAFEWRRTFWTTRRRPRDQTSALYPSGRAPVTAEVFSE